MTVPLDSADEKELLDTPPIDKYGRPTTYLAFRILKFMFSQRDKSFASNKLSKLMAANLSDTELICKQLKYLDLFIEDHSQPSKYRYNLNSTNTETQASFERYLVEVEFEALPVHLMLDYSPSYRSRSDLYDDRF